MAAEIHSVACLGWILGGRLIKLSKCWVGGELKTTEKQSMSRVQLTDLLKEHLIL